MASGTYQQLYQTPAQPGSPTARWFHDQVSEEISGQRYIRTTAQLTGNIDIGTMDAHTFGFNGSTWDEIGSVGDALKVAIANTSINITLDGLYAVMNTEPDTVGLVASSDGTTVGQTLLLTSTPQSGKNALDIFVANLDPLEIDVVSSVLPTGAASETTLFDFYSSFLSKDFATETTLAALNAKFNSLGQKTKAGSVPVVFPSDQTIPVILDEPIMIDTSGLATSANQVTQSTKLDTLHSDLVTLHGYVDGVESLLTTLNGKDFATQTTLASVLSELTHLDDLDRDSGSTGANTLRVHLSTESLAALENITVTVDNADFDIRDLLYTQDSITAHQGGTWNLNNISGTISLPTGASTESTLSGLSSKFGTLGQKTMAGSAPVVLASDQTAIPVSGTITANAGTNLNTSALNLETTQSTINSKLPSTVAADRTTAGAPNSTRLSDGTSFYKATTPSDTQPISAASLPLPSGAASSANQVTSNSFLSSIDSKTPVLVSGRQPVDGSGVTQPVSGTVTANLGTIAGVATESTLSALNTKINTQGQKTMAASTPVVLPSDQSAIPVSQSGNWSTRMQDGAGNLLTSSLDSAGVRRLNIQAREIQTTTDLTGTFTTSGSTAAIDAAGFNSFSCTLSLTAASGTNRTLDIEIQTSDDQVIWTPIIAFKRLVNAPDSQVFSNFTIGARYYRFVYTIAGTTPSFTVAINTTAKRGPLGIVYRVLNNYNLSLAAANNTTAFDLGGCTRLAVQVNRLAGGGGNATVAVQFSNDGTNFVTTASSLTLGASTNGTISVTPSNFKYARALVTSTAAGGAADIFWFGVLG